MRIESSSSESKEGVRLINGKIKENEEEKKKGRDKKEEEEKKDGDRKERKFDYELIDFFLKPDGKTIPCLELTEENIKNINSTLEDILKDISLKLAEELEGLFFNNFDDLKAYSGNISHIAEKLSFKKPSNVTNTDKIPTEKQSYIKKTNIKWFVIRDCGGLTYNSLKPFFKLKSPQNILFGSEAYSRDDFITELREESSRGRKPSKKTGSQKSKKPIEPEVDSKHCCTIC